MLELAKSFITNRTDHPLLVTLFIIAGAFVVAGFAVSSITGNGVASAFLIIYAIISAFLGGVGYGVLLVAKAVQKYQRQLDLAA